MPSIRLAVDSCKPSNGQAARRRRSDQSVSAHPSGRPRSRQDLLACPLLQEKPDRMSKALLDAKVPGCLPMWLVDE